MKTFLILGNDGETNRKQIDKLKSQFSVSDFDLLSIKSETSIGIAQARQAIAFLKMKPFQGNHKMLFIEGIDTATTEAQNALLKILEEAPESAIIVATAGNENRILATVLSRSQIIRIPAALKGTDSLPEGTLEDIFVSSAGKRLILSENQAKSREEAILFVDKLCASLEQQLLSEASQKQKLAICLNRCLQAKKFLEGNLNYRLVLDILLLGF